MGEEENRGERWVWQKRNPGLLNVTLGRTAGRKGGDGGGWKDRLISVFVKIERSRLAAQTTTGWRSNPKRRDTLWSSWKHTRIICTVRGHAD